MKLSLVPDERTEEEEEEEESASRIFTTELKI